MDVNDENIIYESDWQCPVCNSGTNSQGFPFNGFRAVALHIAGKIRGGDHTHRRWAQNNVGDIIYDSYVSYLECPLLSCAIFDNDFHNPDTLFHKH